MLVCKGGLAHSDFTIQTASTGIRVIGVLRTRLISFCHQGHPATQPCRLYAN